MVSQTVRGALYVRDASKPFVVSQPVRGEPVEPHPSTMLPSKIPRSTGQIIIRFAKNNAIIYQTMDRLNLIQQY